MRNELTILYLLRKNSLKVTEKRKYMDMGMTKYLWQWHISGIFGMSDIDSVIDYNQ
jgi:hypothetical protein